MINKKPESVEEYIESFPKETQKILKQVRSIIKKNASKAEERISYGMPGYFLFGQLFFFLPDIKTISGFTPHPPVMRNLLNNYPNTNREKVLSSSRLMNPCL